MAKFEDAIGPTLQHEGRYVNNPADPGGPTKYGITQADMPGVPISLISEQDAVEYYREHYWKPDFSQIENQDVANKIFDMGVNLGVGEAVRLLQRALGLNPVDGVFGPNTLAAVNNAGDAILGPYKQQLVQHYEAIVAAKPQEAVFLNGWLARANS
jgi:lysozyme family protein